MCQQLHDTAKTRPKRTPTQKRYSATKLRTLDSTHIIFPLKKAPAARWRPMAAILHSDVTHLKSGSKGVEARRVRVRCPCVAPRGDADMTNAHGTLNLRLASGRHDDRGPHHLSLSIQGEKATAPHPTDRPALTNKEPSIHLSLLWLAIASIRSLYPCIRHHTLLLLHVGECGTPPSKYSINKKRQETTSLVLSQHTTFVPP